MINCYDESAQQSSYYFNICKKLHAVRYLCTNKEIKNVVSIMNPCAECQGTFYP